jgi:hypothetical protein
MIHRFIAYGTVYLLASVKFIFAPIAGYGLQLHWWETMFCTILGMMTTAVIISFVGEKIRNYFRHRRQLKHPHKPIKVFSKRSRLMVKIWKKTGIWGIAFFTPLLFSPIGGSLIAVSFGVPKQKIWLSMLLSAFFWGLIMCGGLEIFGEPLFNWLKKMFGSH